jgi:hypothetical protein
MSEGAMDRFWAQVNKTGDCWLWAGCAVRGYGRYVFNGKQRPAHRVAFEVTNGPVPPELLIDHLCHTPLCVRPEHLRAATPKENQENRAGAQVNSKSGVRGVFPDKRKPGRWQARVRSNGKVYWAACFDDLKEAEAAVIAKRKEAFTPIRMKHEKD